MSWKDSLWCEVTFKAERSQGPGGQNINKVSSAARLTWDPRQTRLFSDYQKKKILGTLVNLDAGKCLVVVRSQKFRDLPSNKRACLEKLINKISEALKPVKVRKKTKPTKGSKIKAEQDKRKRSEVKKLRAPIRS